LGGAVEVGAGAAAPPFAFVAWDLSFPDRADGPDGRFVGFDVVWSGAFVGAEPEAFNAPTTFWSTFIWASASASFRFCCWSAVICAS
jgi:hypothetical protein